MTQALRFEEFLGEQLAVIDEVLAISGMALSDRPLFASLEFVKACIVDAKGVSLEKPLTQPWFARLHGMVERWYRCRYGERGLRAVDWTGLGVVLIFSTAFRVKVPLTLLEPADRDDRAWVCFAASIHDGEKPLTWIVDPPDLAQMTPDEIGDLEATVCGIAVTTRLIAVDLMSAERPTPDVAAMLGGIRSQLDSAVEHLCSEQATNRGLAIWELHLATEMALKALLFERTGEAKRTHDLISLHAAACAAGMHQLPPDVLGLLLSAGEAIRYRYGENGEPCVRWAFEHYRNTLRAVACVVAAHRRNLVFRDSRFLIQVPPWKTRVPA